MLSVPELQQNATNHDVKVSNLLRQSYLISKKLKDKKMEAWIKKELDGYEDEDKLPDYRNVKGEPKYYNPFYGYSDFIIEHAEIREVVSKRKIYQSIAELEDLYEKSDKYVVVNINPEAMIVLKEGLGITEDIKIFVTNAQIKAIFDSIKTKILEWTVELEEKGISSENSNGNNPKITNAYSDHKNQIYKVLALLIPSIIALNVIKSYFPEYEIFFYYITILLAISIVLSLFFFVYYYFKN